MRHGKKVKKLGKTAAHRKAMLRNMLTSLYKNEKIVTTEAKAKFAKPFAEKLITKALKGTLASKRIVINYLREREVAHNLINDIAQRYADEPTGGYTRIIKMGPRKGDGAYMAVLELVDPESRKASKNRFKKRANKRKQNQQVQMNVEAENVEAEKVEADKAEINDEPKDEVEEKVEAETKQESTE